jgi:hypothetical protein
MKKQQLQTRIKRIASEPHRFGASAPEEVLRERKHSLTEAEKALCSGNGWRGGQYYCPPTKTVFKCARIGIS